MRLTPHLPSSYPARTQTNIRRPKSATDCALPYLELCSLPSGTSGPYSFYGCQTAPGSGVLGNYELCESYFNTASNLANRQGEWHTVGGLPYEYRALEQANWLCCARWW
jgi:hypothetical protein